MLLKFNKEIYKKEAILKGVKAYSKIVDLKFEEEGKYFIIKTDAKLQDEDLIRNEFANYILFNTR